jgi:hypothetical protein
MPSRRRIGVLAPRTSAPLRRHWKLSGSVPLTVAANTAVPPRTTANGPETAVIAGGDAWSTTFKVARALLTLPDALVATTRTCVPSWARVVAVRL